MTSPPPTPDLTATLGAYRDAMGEPDTADATVARALICALTGYLADAPEGVRYFPIPLTWQADRWVLTPW